MPLRHFFRRFRHFFLRLFLSPMLIRLLFDVARCLLLIFFAAAIFFHIFRARLRLLSPLPLAFVISPRVSSSMLAATLDAFRHAPLSLRCASLPYAHRHQLLPHDVDAILCAASCHALIRADDMLFYAAMRDIFLLLRL